MANRKKRLETEQALLQQKLAEQNALRQQKKKKKIRRKLSAAQHYARTVLSQDAGSTAKWEGFITQGLRLAAIRRALPEVLEVLKMHHKKIIRPLGEWKPSRKFRPVEDLIRHAFVQYEMPVFLMKDFLENRPNPLEVPVEKVFFHIAEGKSLRHLTSIRQNISKKEAHWFLHAPFANNWAKALAWARSYNINASVSKATVLADICLKYFSQNAPLWRDFLQFIANNPEESCQFLQELALFMARQWDGEYLVKVDTYIKLHIPALFPKININALSLSGLKRRMAEQEKELDFWRKNYFTRTFATGPLEAFSLEQDEWVYNIRQLMNLDELMRESRCMKHCVRNYHYECNAGTSFIYKMTRSARHFSENVGTIEIGLERESEQITYKLVQFKAHSNRKPPAEAFAVLAAWIKQGAVDIAWDEEGY